LELTSLLLDGPAIMTQVLVRPLEKPKRSINMKKGASLDCKSELTQWEAGTDPISPGAEGRWVIGPVR
jgi:hypothetical protein